MQFPIPSVRSSLKALTLALLFASSLFARGEKPVLGPAEQAKLLQGILDRTTTSAAKGKSPAAAFDIDDTILLTSPRSKFLLIEYAKAHPGAHPDLMAKFEALVPGQMPHGILDTLTLSGVTDKALKQQIRAWWLPKFLSNDYLTHDIPLPGAVAYVHELIHNGSTVYYITARGPKMRKGTESSLVHFGFPLDGKKTHLVMNDVPGAKAPEYKKKAVKELSAKHEFTSLFENEPDNLNAMAEAAPKAQAVFIDTVHTKGAAPVAAGIPWIHGYTLGGKTKPDGARGPKAAAR